MHELRRGESRSLRFAVDVDLSSANVNVTISQHGKIIINKNTSDLIVDESMVVVPVSQNETLELQAGIANVQIRFVTENNIARASKDYQLRIKDVLNSEVLTYGN